MTSKVFKNSKILQYLRIKPAIFVKEIVSLYFNKSTFESTACAGRGTCECYEDDPNHYGYCICENGFTGDYCQYIDSDNDGRTDDQESEVDFEGFGCS